MSRASSGRQSLVTKSDYDPSLVPLILDQAAEVVRALSFPGGHVAGPRSA